MCMYMYIGDTVQHLKMEADLCLKEDDLTMSANFITIIIIINNNNLYISMYDNNFIYMQAL